MDSLAAIVSLQFELDPYETDILFLFCGSTQRLIKGLVWATIHKDDRFIFW
uniref:IS66 family insertion sequence element accessory protein TnpB n=1 Tax=Gemmiger formicilis TaxID=745368 RepID=UPI004027E393